MMEAVTILANTYCSKELTQGLDNQIICLSVINTLFAITAFVGNTVILIAFHKETSLHQPSKALIRSLVASDVCVSFVELVFVAYWISILQERWQTCRILYYAHVIGAIISLYVSLCTLAAISVDRLLALLLGLRYRQIVTLRRVYAVNATLWVFPGVSSAIFWIFSPATWKVWSSTCLTLCLITSLFCYTRIFVRLRHQQSQLHNHPQEQGIQTIPSNSLRYRKTVHTALWLQTALVFCYLPYMLVAPFANREIQNTHESAFYIPLYTTVTLMCFNSTLNPILYCWKIKEVRRTVKDMFCYS